MAIVVSTGAKAPRLSPQEHKERRRLTRSLTFGGLLLLALLFALLLRALAYEAVVITSGSMEPTLRRGDYTLVDHRAAIRGSWARGDVIIFKAPESWKGAGQTLVKRIVGVPGETVAILSGQVLINQQPLPEPYLKELPEPEHLEPVQLRAGQYFVLGDNRSYSDDSTENGPITESDIRGRLERILWPRSRAGDISVSN